MCGSQKNALSQYLLGFPQTEQGGGEVQNEGRASLRLSSSVFANICCIATVPMFSAFILTLTFHVRHMIIQHLRVVRTMFCQCIRNGHAPAMVFNGLL